MSRLSLFWRLFTAFSLLIILSLGMFALVGGAWLEQAVLQAVEERLRAKAVLLRDLVRPQDELALQDRLRELHKELGARITLISGDGRVVGDTDCDDLAGLDNHNHRPEILSARLSSFGTATRYSTTTSQNMMYVARRVGDTDSSVAFVRVAMPVATIARDVRSARSTVWITAAVTAALALFVTWRLVRNVTGPLEQLGHAAAAVATGSYGTRVYLERHDELGRLAQAFNQMSAALDKQLAEILQKRQQLRALLDCMVDAVIAVDAEHNVSFVNERAGALFGLSPERTSRLKLWEVVRDSPVHDLVDRALAGESGRTEFLETLVFSNRVFTVHAARLLPGDPVRGAMLVFHDVTELRRLQRVRHEFVANVSHELRTPLAVIAASVETLQDGAVDDVENRDKFLENIAVHADRLSTVIVDLLDHVRSDSTPREISRHA